MCFVTLEREVSAQMKGDEFEMGVRIRNHPQYLDSWHKVNAILCLRYLCIQTQSQRYIVYLDNMYSVHILALYIMHIVHGMG